MRTSLLTAEEMLGLFEVDGAGKILYYRMDSSLTPPDMMGHNLYDEVAPFANVEAFRQRVTDFSQSAKAADSFDFDCDCDGFDLPVRVLVARIRERINRNNTKSVLLHIRPGAIVTRTKKLRW